MGIKTKIETTWVCDICGKKKEAQIPFSEIGNGDNEAGAKKIEAAIERIHKIRQKAKRGKPSPADKTFASMIA